MTALDWAEESEHAEVVDYLTTITIPTATPFADASTTAVDMAALEEVPEEVEEVEKQVEGVEMKEGETHSQDEEVCLYYMHRLKHHLPLIC